MNHDRCTSISRNYVRFNLYRHLLKKAANTPNRHLIQKLKSNHEKYIVRKSYTIYFRYKIKSFKMCYTSSLIIVVTFSINFV